MSKANGTKRYFTAGSKRDEGATINKYPAAELED
jgi:hypothetical protein